MSDEKHARELIAEATAHINHTLSGIGREGSAVRAAWAAGEGSDDRFALLVKLRTALEAALPGDDDWEYGTAHANEPGEGALDVNRRAAVLRRDAWNRSTGTLTSLLVRRRPAGPWEPVEEVPRG